MKMKRNSSLRRGLTLLELMIVLVILVGIIALVGPRVLGTQKKADIRTAQAQIGNLESALKMFAVDMKTFPTTEEGLKLLVEAPEDEALAKNWDGPYIEGGKLPKDPWGSDFEYEYETESTEEGTEAKTGTETVPLIFSIGPDRKRDTSDDVGNTSKKDESETESTTSGS
jgi:general secretion pathway protein G